MARRAIAGEVVGSLPMPNGAPGLGVEGGHVFLAAGSDGLVVADVSDPTHPVAIGSAPIAGATWDVAVADGLAVSLGGSLSSAWLRVFDVSVPGAPVELGAVPAASHVGRVGFDGRHAWVASGGAGLRIVDVTDPLVPVEVGAFDPPEPGAGAVDVDVHRGHAFVADAAGGLRVVQVANPLWTHQVGWYDGGGAAGVDVRDGLALLTTGDGGLLVLDVAQCTSEVFTDGFESGDAAAWAVPAP